jgi:hypothetical protein
MTLDAEEEDAVPAMKLTPNAAMRARDVSRPRAEHLAEAEAAEAAEAKENTGRGSPAPNGAETGRAEANRAETDRAQTGRAETDRAQTGRASDVAGDDRAGRPGFPRRRRGPRDVKRRGRPSR